MEAAQNLIEYKYNLRYKNWLVLEVIIPIIFILILSIIYNMIDYNYSFGKFFATGDLLLIGIMIILGTQLDIYCENKIVAALRTDKKIDTIYFIVLLSIISLIMFYVYIKIGMLLYQKEASIIKNPASLLTTCVLLSILGCLFSIFVSIYSRRNLLLRCIKAEYKQNI